MYFRAEKRSEPLFLKQKFTLRHKSNGEINLRTVGFFRVVVFTRSVGRPLGQKADEAIPSGVRRNTAARDSSSLAVFRQTRLGPRTERRADRNSTLFLPETSSNRPAAKHYSLSYEYSFEISSPSAGRSSAQGLDRFERFRDGREGSNDCVRSDRPTGPIVLHEGSKNCVENLQHTSLLVAWPITLKQLLDTIPFK